MLIRVLKTALGIAKSTFALTGKLASAVATVVGKIPAAMIDLARGTTSAIGTIVTTSASLASRALSSTFSVLGTQVVRGLRGVGTTVKDATDAVVGTIMDPTRRAALADGIRELGRITQSWTNNVQDFFTVLQDRRSIINRANRPVKPDKGASQDEIDEFERQQRLYELDRARAEGIRKAAEGIRRAFISARKVVDGLYKSYKTFYDKAIASQLELERAVRTSATTIAANADLVIAGDRIDNAVEKVQALAPKLKQIQEDLIRSAPDIVGVTSDELLKTFNQVTIQMGQLVGQTEGLEEIGIADELEAAAYLSKNLAGAMKVVGLRARDVQQEVRAILTGDIDINARLARQLNITRAQLELEKQKGTLVKFLADKTATIASANEIYNESLENTLSVLQEIGQTTLRTLGKAGYAGFERGLLNIREALRGIQPEIEQFSEIVGEAFGTTFEYIAALIEDTIKEIGEDLPSIAETITKFISFIGLAAEGVIRLFGMITNAIIENETLIQKAIKTIGALFLTLKVGIPLVGGLMAAFTIPVVGPILTIGAAIGAVIVAAKVLFDGIINLAEAFSNLLHLGITKFFTTLSKISMPEWLEDLSDSLGKTATQMQSVQAQIEKLKKIESGDIITARNLETLTLFSEKMSNVNEGMQTYHKIRNRGNVNELNESMSRTIDLFTKEAERSITTSAKIVDLLAERQSYVDRISKGEQLIGNDLERYNHLTNVALSNLDSMEEFYSQITESVDNWNKFSVLSVENSLKRLENDEALANSQIARARVMIDMINYDDKTIEQNKIIREEMHKQLDTVQTLVPSLGDALVIDEDRLKATKAIDATVTDIKNKFDAIDRDSLTPKSLVSYADDATIAAENLQGAISRLGRSTEASLVKDLEATVQTYVRSLGMANQPLEDQSALLTEINQKLFNTRDLEERIKIRKKLNDGIAKSNQTSINYLEIEQSILDVLESQGRISTEEKEIAEARIATTQAQIKYVDALNSALDDSVYKNKEIKSQKEKIAAILTSMGIDQEKLNALEEAGVNLQAREKELALVKAQLQGIANMKSQNITVTDEIEKQNKALELKRLELEAEITILQNTVNLNKSDLATQKENLNIKQASLKAAEQELAEITAKHELDLKMSTEISNLIDERGRLVLEFAKAQTEEDRKRLKTQYDLLDNQIDIKVTAMETLINTKLNTGELEKQEAMAMLNALQQFRISSEKLKQLEIIEETKDELENINHLEELHTLLIEKQARNRKTQVGLEENTSQEYLRQTELFKEQLKQLNSGWEFGKRRLEVLKDQLKTQVDLNNEIFNTKYPDSLVDQLGLDEAIDLVDKVNLKIGEIADRQIKIDIPDLSTPELNDPSGLLEKTLNYEREIQNIIKEINIEEEKGLINDEKRAKYAEKLVNLTSDQSNLLEEHALYQSKSTDSSQERIKVAIAMSNAQRELNNLNMVNASIQENATLEMKMQVNNLVHMGAKLKEINSIHANVLSTEEERANVLKDINLEIQKQSIVGNDVFSQYSLENLAKYEAKLRNIGSIVDVTAKSQQTYSEALKIGNNQLDDQKSLIQSIREINENVSLTEEERTEKLQKINSLYSTSNGFFGDIESSAESVNDTYRIAESLLVSITKTKEDMSELDSILVDTSGNYANAQKEIIDYLKQELELKNLSKEAEDSLYDQAQRSLDFLMSRKGITQEIKETESEIKNIIFERAEKQADFEIFKLDFQLKNYEDVLKLDKLLSEAPAKLNKRTRDQLKPLEKAFKDSRKQLKKLGFDFKKFGKNSTKNAVKEFKIRKQIQDAELKKLKAQHAQQQQDIDLRRAELEFELEIFTLQEQGNSNRLQTEQLAVESALKYLFVMEQAGVVAKGTYDRVSAELSGYNELINETRNASLERVSAEQRALEIKGDQITQEKESLRTVQAQEIAIKEAEQAMELMKITGNTFEEAMEKVKEHAEDTAEALGEGRLEAEGIASAASRTQFPGGRGENRTNRIGGGNAQGNITQLKSNPDVQQLESNPFELAGSKAAGSFVSSFVDHLDESMQKYYFDAVARRGTEEIQRTLSDARKAALAREANLFRKTSDGQSWTSQRVSGSVDLEKILNVGNRALENAAQAIATSQKVFVKKQIDENIEAEKTLNLLSKANELAAEGNKQASIRAWDQFNAQQKKDLSDLEYYEFSQRNQNTRSNLIKQSNAVAAQQREQLKEEIRARREEARQQAIELLREIVQTREDLQQEIQPLAFENPMSTFAQLFDSQYGDLFNQEDSTDTVEREQADARLVEMFGQEIADKIAGIIPITKDLITQLEGGTVNPEDLITDNKVFLDPETQRIILSGIDPDFDQARQLIEIKAIKEYEDLNNKKLNSISDSSAKSEGHLADLYDAMFGADGFLGVKLIDDVFFGRNGIAIGGADPKKTSLEDLWHQLNNMVSINNDMEAAFDNALKSGGTLEQAINNALDFGLSTQGREDFQEWDKFVQNRGLDEEGFDYRTSAVAEGILDKVEEVENTGFQDVVDAINLLNDGLGTFKGSVSGNSSSTNDPTSLFSDVGGTYQPNDATTSIPQKINFTNPSSSNFFTKYFGNDSGSSVSLNFGDRAAASRELGTRVGVNNGNDALNQAKLYTINNTQYIYYPTDSGQSYQRATLSGLIN